MDNQIAVKLNKACKYALMQLHNAFEKDYPSIEAATAAYSEIVKDLENLTEGEQTK